MKKVKPVDRKSNNPLPMAPCSVRHRVARDGDVVELLPPPRSVGCASSWQTIGVAQNKTSVGFVGKFLVRTLFLALAISPLHGAEPEPPLNTLSAAEQAQGWKLLFNGTDLAGWHNFRQEGVRSGWQVKDGCLVCADPKNAGDIVTSESFGSFELELDYNIAEAGNSGILYHVTDAGNTTWQTAPECQLLDNEKGADPQKAGWLYGLYQPPVDPATGQPLDATKPSGQWNHVRLLVSPAGCTHEINGRKYFDYVLGSQDFRERVARSKFGKMPGFAQAATGWIGLQGDHGSVSFRNLKIRPLPEAKAAPAPGVDGKEFVPTGKPDASIDLGTPEGAVLIAGEWRYSDTKIVEVDFNTPDKTPGKTYDYEPHAGSAGFDDSKWEVLDPASLKKPRSTGKLCFNWYRLNVTVPERIGEFESTGVTVTFEATIDDYAEVWVDGKLPRAVGQAGGSVVKGFNAANRLIIARNVQPRQKIQLAVFGINGPISAAPDNYIFMRTNPRLDFYKAQ